MCKATCESNQPSPGIKTAAGDAGLLEILQQYGALVRTSEHHLSIEPSRGAPNYSDWEATLNRLSAEERKLEAAVAATPATGYTGLWVKLKFYTTFADEHPEMDETPEAPILRSACADADRLTTAPAGGRDGPDPVAGYGLELVELWRRRDKLDAEDTGNKESGRISDIEWHLIDKTDVVEKLAGLKVATSLEGIIVQLLLARSRVEALATSQLDEYRRNETLREADRLLHFAVEGLELQSGTMREKLGGRTYMSHRLHQQMAMAGDVAGGGTS